MKKKDYEDLINENSINDLIQYAEDEDSNTADTENEEDIPQVTHEDNKDKIVEEENKDKEKEDSTEKSETEEKSEEPYEIDYFDEDIILNTSNKKKKSKKKIVTIVILLAAAAAILGTFGSGWAENYKNNFSANFEKVFRNFKSDKNTVEETQKPVFEYNTEIKSSKIVSLEEAAKTEFVPYRDGVICAKMNYMCYIDNLGNVVWEMNTAIVDPILKAEGSYILLAEKGENKICLYNDNKLLYDVDDQDTITAAQLSSAGDVIAITGKQSYKGGISVYNKNGAQIFSWASGSDTVISADISASSRCVAVALLNTENTARTVIQLFNVNEAESYSKTEIDNSVVYELKFDGEILNAFSDNRITGISSKGKVIYDNDLSLVSITHSAMDENGNKLLSFEDGNTPFVMMFARRGSIKQSKNLVSTPDFIDIKDNSVIYNSERDIYFGKIGAKLMSKYTAAMDIKKLIIISDSEFIIIYSNSIEIVTV